MECFEENFVDGVIENQPTYRNLSNIKGWNIDLKGLRLYIGEPGSLGFDPIKGSSWAYNTISPIFAPFQNPKSPNSSPVSVSFAID